MIVHFDGSSLPPTAVFGNFAFTGYIYSNVIGNAILECISFEVCGSYTTGANSGQFSGSKTVTYNPIAISGSAYDIHNYGLNMTFYMAALEGNTYVTLNVDYVQVVINYSVPAPTTTTTTSAPTTAATTISTKTPATTKTTQGISTPTSLNITSSKKATVSRHNSVVASSSSHYFLVSLLVGIIVPILILSVIGVAVFILLKKRKERKQAENVYAMHSVTESPTNTYDRPDHTTNYDRPEHNTNNYGRSVQTENQPSEYAKAILI